MTQAQRIAGRERARTFRERMRARGLRSVTLWAIDARAPGFAREAARQARVVAEADTVEDTAYLESIQADWGPYDDDDDEPAGTA